MERGYYIERNPDVATILQKDDIEEVDVCKICGSIESTRSSFVEWEDKFINTYGNNYMSIPNKEFKKMVTWL